MEPALYPVVRRLDRQSLAAAGRTGHHRPLFHALPVAVHRREKPRMVPPQRNLQVHLRMGQRHRFRNGRGLADPHLRLPDVRHPVVVDGVVAADRRLPLCQQGRLRAADAQHPRRIPLRTPYDALLTDEEILLGVHQMALSPAQGFRQRETQRRGGLQLSGGRHGAASAAGRHLLRRTARIPAYLRAEGGPRAAFPRLYGHHSSGGQARELHQARSSAERSMSTTNRRLPYRRNSTCIRS